MLAGSCIWTWSTFFVSGRTVGRSENLIGGGGEQQDNAFFKGKVLFLKSCFISLVIFP
jgi:hypothetical protein